MYMYVYTYVYIYHIYVYVRVCVYIYIYVCEYTLNSSYVEQIMWCTRVYAVLCLHLCGVMYISIFAQNICPKYVFVVLCV